MKNRLTTFYFIKHKFLLENLYIIYKYMQLFLHNKKNSLN